MDCVSHIGAAGILASADVAQDKQQQQQTLAIFGDSLNTSSGSQCLSELRCLSNDYGLLISAFINQISAFLAFEALDMHVVQFYPHGLNVASWLQAAGNNGSAAEPASSSTPPAPYLDTAPVATPLAGLVQLARVLAQCKASNVAIGDYVRQLNGITGYGQGMAVAAAVASAGTDDEFVAAAKRALGSLILAGCLPQHVAPPSSLHPSAVADAQQHEGTPAPMMVAQGAPRYVIDHVLSAYNSHYKGDPAAQIQLSATDADDEFIVSGHLQAMYQFVKVVRSKAAAPGLDQSHVPFHARKPEVTISYMSAVAPLYCRFLQPAVDRHLALASAKGWVFGQEEQLLVPVHFGSSTDSKDVCQLGADIDRALAECLYVRPVNWPLAVVRPGITQIADFSGSDSRLHRITRQAVQGRGITLPNRQQETGGQGCYCGDWAREFGPRLVSAARFDGSSNRVLHLDTALSRVLGHPAVMVAAVQPTTADVGFVAAVAHAGYLAELAVDCVRSEGELRGMLLELARQQPAGHGIALSSTLRGLTAWQAQAIADLKHRHQLPIIGVGVEDRIPDVAQAMHLISTLSCPYFAVKPTTAAQIQQTLDIARASPQATIVMQWTGGRTGGTHSLEEFHLPIIASYALIRQHRNVVLVANSGFGDADSALPYVTGAWGAQANGPAMPFDGVMLGSRVMAAREARTSPAVKRLIAAAPGLDPHDIERLFVSDSDPDNESGVVSILAADGASSMHVLANRGALLCKDLSATVFSQPRDKQLRLLLARKDEIVARLNSDYMRPWFGRTADGRAVDLEHMTYAETISRLLELLYIKGEQRWTDASHRLFAARIIDRAASRLLGTERACVLTMEDAAAAEDGREIVLDEAAYTLRGMGEAAGAVLLASEDIQYFLRLARQLLEDTCRPLPFVPRIDADFAAYLLHDPWRPCEDLAAVTGGADDGDRAQRVLVRHGAVAARYTVRADEPVGLILDQTYHGITAALQSDGLVPRHADYVEHRPPLVPGESVAATTLSDAERVYELPSSSGEPLPELSRWLAAIAGPEPSWLRALLTSPCIVQGPRRVHNYVRDLMRPRPGRRVSVELASDSAALSVEVRSGGGAKELDITVEDGGVISVSVFHDNGCIQRALCFDYQYRPETPQAPIHELMAERQTRIHDFFADIWLSDNTAAPEDSGNVVVVSADSVAAYCRATGSDLAAYPPNSAQAVAVPMEYQAVLAVRSILRALLSQLVSHELLHLRQTQSHIELAPGAEPLQVGDTVGCTTRCMELSSAEAAGGNGFTHITTVVLRSSIQRAGSSCGTAVATVTSTFTCPSSSPEPLAGFRHVDEPLVRLTIASADDIAVLGSKDWFLPAVECNGSTNSLKVGDVLEFRLFSDYELKATTPDGVDRAEYKSVRTAGGVYRMNALYDYTHIATVDYADGVSCGNPVTAYLLQRAVAVDDSPACLFDDLAAQHPGDSSPTQSYCLASGLPLVAPASAAACARAVGSRSPHIANSYVADLGAQCGSVPDQWASAAVRRLIEAHVGNNSASRVRSLAMRFAPDPSSGSVLAGERLEAELTHVGMRSGRLIVEAVLRRGRMAVAEATAEVAPPRTAYIFTGQGSQEAGMGFALYETSDAVRAAYDRAERLMRKTFGVPFLDIMRHNPRELTVYFGGPGGDEIRRNYMELQRPTHDSDKLVPLFPEITPESFHYTYRSPTGLLNATQFAQPAIILYDVAMGNELRARGLLDDAALLAGHSLGEYGALATHGVMTLEDMIYITFVRGMTMQSTVPRGADQRSDFALVAVNPSRVHRSFDEAALALVIDQISQARPGLLEIVNYNVRGFQYVVAGTRRQLALLAGVLDAVSQRGLSVNASAKSKALVAQLIAECPCGEEVERSRATIPIPGIDVPFHSSHLLPGADSFRSCILRSVRVTDFDCARLANRYIPNLTAKPFAVTPEYFRMLYEMTGSPAAAHELSRWPADDVMSDRDRARVARTLMVELLTYQFASPVRWIETQDRLLAEFGVERIVEIGPVATLCRLAEGSVKLAGLENQVSVLHMFRDEDEVYFRHLPAEEAEEAAGGEEATAETTETTENSESDDRSLRSLVLSAPSSESGSATSTVAAASPPDIPLTSLYVVRAVIAQKLKRRVAEVPGDRSVRDLTGGKSTLQNEILGDLLKEFNISVASGAGGGSIPDRPDEISLLELSASFRSGGLGKHTSAQIARLFSTKMPGGFTPSALRRRLDAAFGISRAHQQDAVLLLALTMEPAARLGSEQEAHAWVGGLAQEYANMSGFKLGSASSKPQTDSSSSAAVTINSAEFDRAQAAQRALARGQMEACAEYLDIDIHQACQQPLLQSDEGLQGQLDVLADELGPEFLAGIQPLFDARKARRYDSSWNWARADAVQWVNQALLGKESADHDEPPRLQMLANRADASLVRLLAALCRTLDASTKPGALARRMHAACEAAVGQPPATLISCYRPSQPTAAVGAAGSVTSAETPRLGEPTMAAYADRMCAEPPASAPAHHRPLLHLRHKTLAHAWEYARAPSAAYHASLAELASPQGCTAFANTSALVTGCSRGSIGAEIISILLSGGAKVIATTSSFSSRATVEFFEDAFRRWGARGAELVVVPYNQGSARDTQRLIEYIYGALGRDLDYVLPFAASGAYGRDVSNIDGSAELAQRVMATNVLRLVGGIRSAKMARRLLGRPTLCVLPLSPNHGDFGSDGLYGESKAALHTAFSRWQSEGWAEFLSVAGANIGWTRATGLMAAHDAVAPAVERLGARTFSVVEMALNVAALLHPRVAALARAAPVWADLTGGLHRIADVGSAVARARTALQQDASRGRAVAVAAGADVAHALGHAACLLHMDHAPQPRFRHAARFPPARNSDQLLALSDLRGMADLDKVVVVAGYGEVGPLGNAETRWEMEAYGEFSLEGCVELAWIMGLIKHFDGVLKDEPYSGWVDAQSGEPVDDKDVKPRYERQILAHTGIRLLEPAMLEDASTNPAVIPIFRELQLAHDLPPFDASADEAAQFKLRNGALADVWAHEDGSWSVRLRRGAVLLVPKALRFDRLVGAQLPTGWDPARFGVPKDVVSQVDPVTCYALVAAAEALVRAGVTDPYELYRHVHVSEVGTSLGAGAGGIHAIRAMHHRRLTDKHVQSDVLQETFANTTAAWINMLLISASGPIKIPTGGCATAVLSFDVAADTIRAGKARVMLAGAFEGFVEEGSYEFAQMGATASSADEAACGREPSEMSRPCTDTRTGFVEAQGAGVAVLMSASTAIAMGAPIYAILAHSATATDKQGASLPAPGQGLMTTARTAASSQGESPLLDIGYRRRQLDRALQEIDTWVADEEQNHPDSDYVQRMADARRRQALHTWGTEFWHGQQDISPLRGALAAWGLAADDIGLASFHGTGTVANDRNESVVLDRQLRHLGRTPGLAVPAVCQKHLTGHPKGPAAAWMLNSAIQSMRTGIVPGNRNADNIDPELRQHEYIVYPARPMQTPKVKAALLKSFGFGQVGAELLLVHPDCLLATLTPEQLDSYNSRLAPREAKSYRYWQDTFVGNHSFVQVKDRPPYTQDQESEVYLDPLARAQYDKQTGEYHF
ncbi:fatty acid synthase alpha subunit Lsd1 [Coemansia sp. RSA 2322]|nr:fatty acid synthase alpha subunit Lsd1 [Coemansia sp. RSA 2322]